MKRLIAILAVAAIMAVVFISGCTQGPPASPAGNNGTGGAIDKAAEDKAASALESELDQAVANMSSSDVENALLNP
jgi:type IV secretory pathway TrbL component